jgi:hypothetical protein
VARRKADGHDAQGRHEGFARADAKSPWRLVCTGWSWRETWLALVEQTRDQGDEIELQVVEAARLPGTVSGGIEIAS